jgi:hypothetical protein
MKRAMAAPEAGGNRDLRHDGRYQGLSQRQQIPQREMQPDTEHQEDHADIGELQRQSRIADEAGRERAYRNAGHQIAGDGRDLQPVRDRAEHECKPDADDDHRDEGRLSHVLAFACLAQCGKRRDAARGAMRRS